MDFEFNTESTGTTETDRTTESNGKFSFTDTNPERAASTATVYTGTDSNAKEEKKRGGKASELVIIETPQGAAGTDKPKRTRQTKAKKPDVNKNLAENLSIVISGFYSMTGQMLRAPYFNVTDEEADRIALPASKILARSQFAEQLEKSSDGIALIAAALAITAPRYMIYAAQKKEQKAINNLKGVTPKNGNETRTSTKPTESVVTPNVADPADIVIPSYDFPDTVSDED